LQITIATPSHLGLDRPLAMLDLESTGTDPIHDRVVEVAVVKVTPTRQATVFHSLVNPGRPVAPEATAVHGLHDVDLGDQPTFKDIAAPLLAFLDGCDLAGFGLTRFDRPCWPPNVSGPGAAYR
jgi:DNA polymerase-3 subunit epsilon